MCYLKECKGRAAYNIGYMKKKENQVIAIMEHSFVVIAALKWNFFDGVICQSAGLF